MNKNRILSTARYQSIISLAVPICKTTPFVGVQDVSECLSLLLDSISEDARSLQAEANTQVVNPVVSNFTFSREEQYRQGHMFPFIIMQ